MKDTSRDNGSVKNAEPQDLEGVGGTNVPGVLKGETIVSVPLSLTLSALNALDGDGCRPLPTDGLPSGPSQDVLAEVPAVPPHILSRLVLIREYLRGRRSPWHPYIATLPQPGRLADWLLPAYWPEHDAAWLAGTNVGSTLAEVRDLARREYVRWVKRISQTAHKGWEGCDDSLLWRWACCIFASRSFRPSGVFPQSVLEAWKPRYSQLILDEDDESEDCFAALLPLVDLGNHAVDVVPRWVPVAGSAEGGSSDDGDAHAPDGRRARMEWVASVDIPPGEQVFNNYGMKTNSELLLGYGFVIPETDTLHNDYVHIRTRWESETGETVEEVAVEESDTREGKQATKKKAKRKKDFLVSLRPMDDPSSVVGRARNTLYIGGDSDRELPGSMKETFAHVETELVWDILIAQIGVAAPGTDGREGGHAEVDTVALQDKLRQKIHKLPEEQLDVLRDGAVGALTDKLLQELHKVLAEELDGEPSNKNQRLAATYREQHRKVLLQALASLGADVEIQAG